MRTKLEVISKNWNKHYQSQPNILISKEKPLIKLNHQKGRQSDFLVNGENINSSSSLFSQNSSNKVVKRITYFIHKIQETLKKILYQKDIKLYIQYAQTSQAEIIDSFNHSLDKFRQLLYQIKAQAYISDSNRQSQQLLSSKSSQKFMTTNEMISQTSVQNKRINADVLEFIFNYFEDHMVPQTHWSVKSKKQQKQKKGYFSNLFDKYFKIKCGKSQQYTTLQNMQDAHIIQTMSNLVNQMNKQESLSNSRLSLSKQHEIFMKPIQQTLHSILKIQQLKPIEQMNSTQKIAYLLDLQSKVFVISQFIQSAAYFQDDITTLPKSSYQKVWQFIHQNNFGNQQKVNFQYKMMKMLMIITNASVIRQLQVNSAPNSWYKKLVFGLSFPIYFLNYQTARLQNHKFLRKPQLSVTKSIWNLPEKGFIKQIKKPLIFDSIAFHIQFYIPRTNSRILKNYPYRKYPQNLDIYTENKNSFKVRLLNYKQLQKNKQNPSQVFQTIIIHYHGGGFIALSSCTAQTYTRKWANSLKVPVFSVDYGKPPQFRFPTPVLDCLDAYNFIINQIHKYFNIRPKRVFVTGDSAGGNLACALTGLTMKLNMKIPEGLLLVYPAVDTRTKFTPSRINSFNDIILYPTLLLLCMKQYLGNIENQDNPLASPILLTQDYISDNGDKSWPKNWPKTILMVGKKDPLYDDTIKLCQKLAGSNIQFHCEVYKNFSHAFLSIDKMVKQCEQTIKDSIVFFEKLLSGQKIGVKQLLI